MTAVAVCHDHDHALQMMSRPQPVQTRRVGYEARICPRQAITRVLTAVGHGRLPSTSFRGYDGLHLHPAIVAAAAHATCELVATRSAVPMPGSDEGLYERLRGGWRSLGAASAQWTEMALQRLQWLAPFAPLVTGGTRVHGLVRWVTTPAQHEFLSPVEDPTGSALLDHLLLAYTSPPISSLRRAPSLEFYRESGYLILRHFGAFEIDPSEGR